MKKIFSFVIVIIFIIFLFLIPKKHVVENIKSVQIAGKEIKVDLALTEAQQEQGLSGRKNLDPNTGMLFVFEKSGQYGFWMKDMNFPIDIIWLSEDMKVIYIKGDARPELYPESYGPSAVDGSAKYVLEVVDGFSDKNNLKVGDVVQFEY